MAKSYKNIKERIKLMLVLLEQVGLIFILRKLQVAGCNCGFYPYVAQGYEKSLMVNR